MKDLVRAFTLTVFSCFCFIVQAQVQNFEGEIMASTPPMHCMIWNNILDNFNKKS